MEHVRITEKSAVIKEPGRYYVLVNAKPSDEWQRAFLRVSRDSRLGLKVEGSMVTYSLPEGSTTAECEQIIQGFMDKVGGGE